MDQASASSVAVAKLNQVAMNPDLGERSDSTQAAPKLAATIISSRAERASTAASADDVVRELKRVKGAMSFNSSNKNKPGGTGRTTNNETSSAVEVWQARIRPVSTATETGSLISTDDYKRAAEDYYNLCDTVENGKFKNLKDLCWRYCTRVGCGRKSCKRNKSRKIPEELISRWPDWSPDCSCLWWL